MLKEIGLCGTPPGGEAQRLARFAKKSQQEKNKSKSQLKESFNRVDKDIEQVELCDSTSQCGKVLLLMHSSKYIQKNVIERFSEKTTPEDSSRNIIWNSEERDPKRLSQFFKTAEHRKRQILERMLMD